MNSTNLLLLADTIEAADGKHFNMTRWASGFTKPEFYYTSEQILKDPTTPAIEQLKHSCGTSACIAGWAVLVESPDLSAEEYVKLIESCDLVSAENSIAEKARQWLGLTPEEAYKLFQSRFLTMSKEQAVRTLHHAAKTGEIDCYIGERQQNSQ